MEKIFNSNQKLESIVLNCSKGRCCPTVHKTEEGFMIKDDYNGSVKLNREQLSMLKEAIDEFEKEV